MCDLLFHFSFFVTFSTFMHKMESNYNSPSSSDINSLNSSSSLLDRDKLESIHIHHHLPKSLVQQLVKDIEQAGGIDNASIKKICDKKPDIYGRPNSLSRRKIQNKAARLKKLTPNEYKSFLRDLSGKDKEEEIQPSRTPPPAAAETRTTAPKTPSTSRRLISRNSPSHLRLMMMSPKLGKYVESVMDKGYLSKYFSFARLSGGAHLTYIS